MTKRKWEKADQYVADPGAVIELPELRQPERWTSPAERKRRADERLQRNRELKKRSEKHDQELAIRPVLDSIRRKEDSAIPLDPIEKLILKIRGQRDE